jgi:hypothetical protein
MAAPQQARQQRLAMSNRPAGHEVGSLANNGWWAIASKQPEMSASRIHRLDPFWPRAM